MLWTDKSSMEEFLCEPINKSLYGLYLELRDERWHIGPDESAVLLFNEIYYQLTKLEYEYNFDYNFNFDDYTQEIEANRAGKEHGVIFVFKMFFAFLLLRQNNTSVAKAFQRSIYYHYHRTWDVRTNCAFGAIIQEEEKYPVELIERAVKGMLPKGRLGRSTYKKLFVYAGSEHPHMAQKPVKMD